MKKYITLIRDFLTKNTSSKQTVIKNTFWLLLAEGISKWSLAILVIMIGRIFWKEVFGQYSYLSVILTFLVVFADMGLTQLAVRDYQHIDEKSRRQYLVTGLWTKILLSLAVVAVYIVILRYTADTSFLWIIGLILLTNNLTNSFLEYIRSTFRSLQKWETELRIKLVQWVGNLLLIPLLYVYQSLPLNLLGQSIVTIVTIGYAWWLVHKRQLVDHKPEVMVTKGGLVRNGWMFAMSALFTSLYYYVDSLIIQHYWGFSANGEYWAAYKLITTLILPLFMLGNASMPMISNKYKIWIADFKQFISQLNKITFAVSFIIFPLLLYYSSDIVFGLYWTDFSWAGSIFFWLLVSVWIVFCYTNYSRALLASKQKYHTYATSVWLIFNIIANLIFVPKYGAIGAAITTVITEAIVWLFIYYFYCRVISGPRDQ
jgi:O-antigen/teichoic acid export membrane protein